MRKTEALELAQKLCAEADANLLFLVRFGSELYGTALPGKSDTDLRGLFLPSLPSLAVRQAKDKIRFSTGTDNERNAAQDIDLDLCSLQKWLLELLPAGDIGALDLLFAPSHAECVLLQSPLLAPVFAQPLRLLNLGDSSGCCNYAISQARKYGIQGSRLGALKRALKFSEAAQPGQRLVEVMNGIISACSDSVHCAKIETAQGPALNIAGKIYPAQIRIAEFRARLSNELKRNNNGAAQIDFKALAHAVRACDQMEELLCTGAITFPLQSRAELIRIKTGQYSWPELEPLILKKLEQVKRLCHKAENKWDGEFARQIILAGYGMG